VTRSFILACGAILIALGAAFVAHQVHASKRPYYLMINETGQHDFDLAFRMSLKLAEGKSGIENALVLMNSLPPSKSIEEAASGDLHGHAHRCAAKWPVAFCIFTPPRRIFSRLKFPTRWKGEIPDAYLPSAGGGGEDVHAFRSAAGFHLRARHHDESARHGIERPRGRGRAALVARRVPVGRRRLACARVPAGHWQIIKAPFARCRPRI